MRFLLGQRAASQRGREDVRKWRGGFRRCLVPNASNQQRVRSCRALPTGSIPRNSGVFNPSQFDPEKNRITYQRTENLGGTRADLYRVEPLDAKTPVRYYNVWVGGVPGRILKMENLSFRGTKGLVKLSYGTVAQGAGKWLLPENVHVHLTFPEGGQSPDASSLITKDNPFSGGMGRLDEISGEGDIHITYGDWRVNTGLDESLFIKK